MQDRKKLTPNTTSQSKLIWTTYRYWFRKALPVYFC